LSRSIADAKTRKHEKGEEGTGVTGFNHEMRKKNLKKQMEQGKSRPPRSASATTASVKRGKKKGQPGTREDANPINDKSPEPVPTEKAREEMGNKAD